MIQSIGIALIVLFLGIGLFLLIIFRSRHPDELTRISRNKMGKILGGAFIFYISIVLGLMFMFRGSGNTVSGDELMAVVAERAERDAVLWHYIGTYQGYDYFHYTDAEGEDGYRVKEGEIVLEGRILPENDKELWVELPW